MKDAKFSKFQSQIVSASASHQATHWGSGGSPQKSHFKGMAVSGSLNMDLAGHEALHTTHPSISFPSTKTTSFELHMASVYGPAITGRQ